MTIKFDNTDRRHVVDILAEHVGSRLSRVGSRHIYLKDESNNRYVVLGGTDDWHGIPDDIIEDIEENHRDSNLVVAVKNRTSLRIYWGEIEPLLRSLGNLPRPGNNKYTFHVDERHTHLSIREARDVTLEFLKEVPHSETDRTQSKSKAETEKLIDGLTLEEKQALLRDLKDDDI